MDQFVPEGSATLQIDSRQLIADLNDRMQISALLSSSLYRVHFLSWKSGIDVQLDLMELMRLEEALFVDPEVRVPVSHNLDSFMDRRNVSGKKGIPKGIFITLIRGSGVKTIVEKKKKKKGKNQSASQTSAKTWQTSQDRSFAPRTFFCFWSCLHGWPWIRSYGH